MFYCYFQFESAGIFPFKILVDHHFIIIRPAVSKDCFSIIYFFYNTERDLFVSNSLHILNKRGVGEGKVERPIILQLYLLLDLYFHSAFHHRCFLLVITSDTRSPLNV